MSRAAVIAWKEFRDSIRSRRFYIVLAIFALLFLLSLSTMSLSAGILQLSLEKLFLQSVFGNLTFIASLLGVALGFSAISGEREKGTLLLLLVRPVSRDQILNGKLLGSLAVIALSLYASFFLLLGAGMSAFNLVFDAGTFARGIVALVFVVLYSMIYYAASLLFSVIASRSSRSMVLALAFWIIMVIVVPIIASIIAFATVGPMPSGPGGFERSQEYYQKIADIQAAILSFTPQQNLQSIINNLFGKPVETTQEIVEGTNATIIQTMKWAEPKGMLEALADSGLNILVLAAYFAFFYGLSYALFVSRKEEK